MSREPTDENRKVSLVTAVAIVVASMVGTGIFGSLGFQVAAIPTGFPIMLLWVIGGILAFCGAVCYAELSAMMPRSGGEYHLLREIYHPWVGFLSGWVSATVGFAAPIALNATLMGNYLISIFEIPTAGFPPFLQPSAVFAIPIVLLIAFVHLGNLSRISRFQVTFTVAKVILILTLSAAAFLLGSRQPVSFLPRPGDGERILSGAFAISLVYVLYAYSGWNAATYIVGELKNPKRNLPLALLIGTGFVTLIYVLLNASFLYSTPIEKMAGVPEVGLVAAREILGEKGGTIMGLLISFGLISTISSMTWAGPRVGATVGEDYRLFSFLKRRNRNGVPAWAILLQTLLVLVLVSTASFEKLLNYIQAILTISSLLVVMGVFVMRIKRPRDERVFRAWGYPLSPIIFGVFSVYVLYFQIRGEPVAFGWGMLTLAAGGVVHVIAQRFERRSPG